LFIDDAFTFGISPSIDYVARSILDFEPVNWFLVDAATSEGSIGICVLDWANAATTTDGHRKTCRFAVGAVRPVTKLMSYLQAIIDTINI
jgi:hypothetical protein